MSEYGIKASFVLVYVSTLELQSVRDTDIDLLAKTTIIYSTIGKRVFGQMTSTGINKLQNKLNKAESEIPNLHKHLCILPVDDNSHLFEISKQILMYMDDRFDINNTLC
jgi:hypothetical protein